MSQVIINDIPPYTQAMAILNQIVFGTNWTANYPSDVVVYVTPVGDAPDDQTQILSYPSDYSVAFIGDQQEVQVTLVTPSAQGNIVTITRMTPADRENLYSNTNFLPSMLNNDFGILTLVDQQAQLVNQSIAPRYNYSAIINPNPSFPTADTILPILLANQIWVKNNNDTAIIGVNIPSGGIGPADATYLLLTPDTADLPNSFALSSLTAGLLVNDPVSEDLLTTSVAGALDQIDVNNPTGIGGAITISIAANPILDGTQGMGVPQGTTAQRVVPGVGQAFRYNTDIGAFEYWSGSAWDQLGSSGDLANYLPLSGGTMTGFLILNADPTVALGAATKQYVDNNLSNYLPLAGGTMTGSLFLASDPSSPSQAATKNYVDNLVQNITLAASYATTANLASWTYSNGTAGVGATLTAPSNGSTTIDGNVPVNGNRILVPFQTSAFQNGIYTIVQGTVSTPTVLTRATDYNQASDMQAGDTIAVVGGNTYATTSWMMTQTAPITVGTTAITWMQQAGPSGALLAVNNLSDVSNPTISFNNISPLTTKGDLIGYSTQNVRIPVASGDGKILQVSSGSSVGVAYSTATYPVTTTINQLLYSSAANTIVGLATVNSGVLVTSVTGVPSISTTLPSGLTIAGYAKSGSNSDITALNVITTLGNSGNTVLTLSGSGGNANNIDIFSAATGNNPLIQSIGTDTTIGMNFSAKALGSFNFLVNGTTNFSFQMNSVASPVNYIASSNAATTTAPFLQALGTDTNIGFNLITKGTGALSILANAGAATLATFNITNTAAVNFPVFSANTTGNAPSVAAGGSDTNIYLALLGKGTGGVNITGTTDGTSAGAGILGEFKSSVIAGASAVTMAANAAVNITSISLTAGDWDVWGNIAFPTDATTTTGLFGWISSSSATLPDASLRATLNFSAVSLATNNGFCVPQMRFNLTTTTTIFLSGQIGAASGSGSGCGGIYARRIR